MKFRVYDRGETVKHERNTVNLYYDNWDDYSFKTSFYIRYIDENSREHPLGPVKIGCASMGAGKIFDQIPKSFTALSGEFFSLGQDEDYYENITKLGDAKRQEILTALQDVAFNLDHFKRYSKEQSMAVSLMRSVPSFKITSQLNRMAHGGVRLTKYDFTYSKQDTADTPGVPEISFAVKPNSIPPTNVHVLIGRNGIGKTNLIKNMIHSIRCEDSSYGTFNYEGRIRTQAEFANIICVAFSPFDDFSNIEKLESSIPYSYIGLDKTKGDLLHTIEQQFIDSFNNCIVNAKKKRLWLDSISVLKSDPTFEEEHIDSLINDDPFNEFDISLSNEERIRKTFSKLSSGHKVVLLIITCCVDKIEEKSIIFMDEPENHLHPPLLSALIRALSNLLIDRNGAAIISTHSPVVLQEVPSSCVWALRKCGSQLVPERLSIQTFGSSISQLTNEVFRLEVTDSGFHRMLSSAVDSGHTYSDILLDYDEQLGDEAKLHLRTLLAMRDKGES